LETEVTGVTLEVKRREWQRKKETNEVILNWKYWTVSHTFSLYMSLLTTNNKYKTSKKKSRATSLLSLSTSYTFKYLI
jgi:hypothetical protein